MLSEDMTGTLVIRHTRLWESKYRYHLIIFSTMVQTDLFYAQ